MSVEIYYFTGTGNSLAVAREIAGKTDGRLTPMAVFANGHSVKTAADAIGLVFPAYNAQLFGVPLIVERFVEKLEDIGTKYIFAVCTCGGIENVNALPALINLGKMIKARGGVLAAGFGVKLPMNTLDYSHIPFPVDQNRETMFLNCAKKIEAASRCAGRRKKSRHKIKKALLNRLMSPLYRMLVKVYMADLRRLAKEPEDTKLGFRELIPLTDRSIRADEACNGCATCVRVCPVHNIKMTDKRPVWLHHCEMCLACAEWCPQKAVRHGYRDEGKYYRHPAVTVSDMFGQSETRV